MPRPPRSLAYHQGHGRFNHFARSFRTGYPLSLWTSRARDQGNDDDGDSCFVHYGCPPSYDDDPFGAFRRVNAPIAEIDDGKSSALHNNNEAVTLKVTSVEFNIVENCRHHHTSEFDVTQSDETPNPQLVVRRGQPFNITVTFNRPYDKSKDDLRLIFQAGDEPLPSKGTEVEIVLSDFDLPKEWGAQISKQDGNLLDLTIFTPPNCYIAKWKLKVDVLKKADRKTTIYRYSHGEPVYILFNPWCKDDMVYKEDGLQEYILKDTGKIYAGYEDDIEPRPWNFGQFEEHVLDCAMYLLNRSQLKWPARGNPIKIIRQLTALVNAPDEGGVLEGNWSGDYKGGKPPLTWTGSAPILQEYYTKKQPVKFGQCWVFSGVLTTVCRALGIPARSVTNFCSAHDTDGSVCIDIHFNSYGEVDEKVNSDSVWNFHVWNEAWMARPDLPPGYGGWQVVDATPQEISGDEGYCCGPASVVAVRNGELGLLYDVEFVFAEVNADIVHWYPRDGSFVRAKTINNCVGLEISTKSVLGDEREAITYGHYKYQEDSPEERAALLNALGKRDDRRLKQRDQQYESMYDVGPKDVECELVIKDGVSVGEDFDVILQVKNKSSEERTVGGRLAAKTMFYTGVEGDKVKKLQFQDSVQGGKCMEQTMEVQVEDYRSKLKDMCMIKLTAIARVQETNQVLTLQKIFKLSKPSLTIKVPSIIKQKQSFDVEVSFTNPLDESLTNCYLEVEGPGLQKRQTHPQRNVKPKQTLVTIIELTPRKLGERELVIIFNSDQLEDINATKVVHVM
ncbi:hypothetical protein SNE40_017970 [Patella caerulea]|uniref:protein-glutamine gamma-glutamyltransferase n=1 Tax=Patella caerulea TaxID=87958 RepID=A0AAN8PF24_PATCE